MNSKKREYMNKNQRNIFYFLFFVIFIPTLCAGVIIYTSLSINKIIYLILLGIQSMAPALAAVITVYLSYSLKGLMSFLKDKFIINRSFKYSLIAFLIPMGLLTITKMITVIFQNDDLNIVIPSKTKLIIIFWSLIAEELGWRGFLQDRIEQIIGMFFTPLIIGTVWGLWHYHYFLIGEMNVSFLLLILGCIFESYGYYVITKMAQGNIIPASIWHFSSNLFINLFSLNTNNDGNNLSYLTVTLIYGFCVIAFLVYYHYKKNVI